MKGKWIIASLFCLFIGVIACKKQEAAADQTMQFIWEQTQCDDPWVNDLSSDANSLKNFNQYLTAAGLTGPLLSVSLKATSNPPANCTACNCKTGKVFYVIVMQSDDLKQKYLQAGFQQ